MVGKAFATVSRDESASARRSLENDLAGLVDRAHDGGGREFYLLMDVLRGIPLAATLVVTVVPEPVPADVAPEILARVLANDPNSEPAVLEVAGENVPAVRRSEAKIMREEIPGLGPARLTFTGLDVFVPFPDRSQILLLTFRTPMEPIAASMMVLFEAVAGSLRWREA
ncbi:hypothetical protein JCM9957A_67350 [Kineosporia succinea]